ncbi:hypothetical protein NEOLI_003267 [Neolecta irregularis DAH-3]|uniref:Uncharacterized protein n=1 Tax=Neolecta irregularis (strain DAH-3) TaxID=1198029 RepID=A0A1U7LPD4_NEOID|nr:hypothetical protein NEOLI_003267 [Neolecta irregularis DAH-3]|eukprot:OLL24488.1 hypothetical protein NEOLI_003267 [Neolecta irregularis DAH-3]
MHALREARQFVAQAVKVDERRHERGHLDIGLCDKRGDEGLEGGQGGGCFAGRPRGTRGRRGQTGAGRRAAYDRSGLLCEKGDHVGADGVSDKTGQGSLVAHGDVDGGRHECSTAAAPGII